ncbi:MAG: hypothetical protein WC596_00585 [Candidatus Shapirobacteria bacterium]
MFVSTNGKETNIGIREEEVRTKAGKMMGKVSERLGSLGVETRVVGSFGFYGLTGIEPRLLRGVDGSEFKVVDVDYLVGLPKRVSLPEIKRCCDELWEEGMSGEYKMPISPVNLPKEIANDPMAVFDFRWRTGEPVVVQRGFRKIIFPIDFCESRVVRIYGKEVETLGPEAQVVFRLVNGWRNPVRAYDNFRKICGLIKRFPEFDFRRYLGYGVEWEERLAGKMVERKVV